MQRVRLGRGMSCGKRTGAASSCAEKGLMDAFIKMLDTDSK